MVRATPSPRVAVPREIWVLVAAALLVALGYGVVAPILPQYAHSFDVSLTAASAIVTVFSLTRLAFAPASGRLVSRFGERWMYVGGLAMVALSTYLCAIAQGYWDLLLYRALGGIGSVTFTVSGIGLLVRLSPPQARGRTSAMYGSAFLLGNVLGPLLGTALGFLGYRVPFVIYGTMLVLALLVAALFLPRAPERPATEDARPQLSLREVIGIPAYRALLVSNFANGWVNFGVRISMVPLMAGAVASIGGKWAGIALTLFALGNVLGQQFTGRLVDSAGRRPVLVTGLLTSGLTTVVFGLSTSVAAFLSLSLLSGVGASMVQPASQAMLGDIIGADRNGGQALSSYTMASDLGSMVGVTVAGLLADLLGFGWSFGLSGTMLLVAIAPWAIIRRDRVHHWRHD